MSSAREVIAEASGLIVGVNKHRQADAILSALATAGYRILDPDEVKIIKESLERINKNSNGRSKSDIILAS